MWGTDGAHAVTHIVMVAFAAVVGPMRASFDAGLFSIAVIGNISYFAFGLLAPLSGWLADHIGSRRVLIICLAGMAAACVTVAAAPNIYALGIGLGALGLFAGLYHPSGLSLLARRVGGIEKAMAYHGICGSLGLAAGPLLAGAVTAFAGWRWAYGLLVIPCATLAAFFAFFTAPDGDPSAAGNLGRAFPLRTSWPALTVFFGVIICIGLIFHGTTTFLPTHLGTLRSLFVGNALTTATLLAGVAGQFVGGVLASRLRHEIVLAVALTVCGAATLGLGLTSGPWLLGPALVFGFSHFATQPVTNSLISRLASARRQGLAYGVNAFCTFGVGSFGTGVAGFIGERFGLARSFTVLGLAAFASLPLILALGITRNRMQVKAEV